MHVICDVAYDADEWRSAPEPSLRRLSLGITSSARHRPSARSPATATRRPRASNVTTATARFLAFRRSLPRPPRLARATVSVRGLDFAVYRSPPIPGAAPLVCVNGGLLFDHSLLWPALSPLASNRQLIFWDQRGRGESAAPPGLRAARIEHDAGDLTALRIALDLDRWDVLGHSWGGGVAMLAAAGDPAGVRRLVLVNAVGATSDEWLDDLHDRAIARLDSEAAARLDAASDAIAAADPAAGRTNPIAYAHAYSDYSNTMYPAWFAEPALATLFTPPRSTSRTGAVIAARLRREGYDWRETIRGTSVPTLVLHGADDLLPVAVAEATATLLPASTLELVPGAGHLPFWERPDLFFPAVERFLAADGSPP